MISRPSRDLFWAAIVIVGLSVGNVSGAFAQDSRLSTEDVRFESLRLTTKEREYLANNPVIPFCVNPDEMPTEGVRDGRVIGMTSDYLRLFGRKLGVDFKLWPTANRQAALQSIRNGMCDIFPAAQWMPHLSNDLSFTQPYIQQSIVIATRHEELFVDDFETVKERTFSTVQGHDLIRLLRQAYPRLHLQEAADHGEALRLVESGNVYGFIDSLGSTAYEIQNQGLFNLKIAGKLEQKLELSVAVSRREPVLFAIFEKAVDSLTEADKQAVHRKWLTTHYEKSVDWSVLWSVVGGSVAVMALLLIWIRIIARHSRQLEAAQRETERALLAERESAQNQIRFADMVSHEYRTPVSVINANLDIMELLAAKHTEELGPPLEKMRRAVKRLVQIVETGLHRGRMDEIYVSPEMCDLDLRHTLDAALEHIVGAYPDRNIEIEYLEDVPMESHGDPELLEIVFVNLCENALKYSAVDSVVRIHAESGNANWRISVEDQGCGISEEDLGQVFDKYYRTISSQDVSGVGIGLHLVKRIVEKHGGFIAIESQVDVGTTVTVKLPKRM